MERFKHKFFFYCSGQGIAEYALIMLFVGVVSIAVLSALGTSVKDVYSTAYEALSSVGTDSEDTPPDDPPPSDDPTPPDDPPPSDDPTPPDDPPPSDDPTPPDDPPPSDDPTLPDDPPPSEEETPQPPTAYDDMAETFETIRVSIPLLSNDIAGSSQLNVSTLTVVSLPSHGIVTVNENGTVDYLPVESGEDSFSYTIQAEDGTISNAAVVRVTVWALGPVCDGDNLLPECYVQDINPGAGITGVSTSSNKIYITYNQPMNYGGDTGSVETTSYYSLYQTGYTTKKVSVLSASYNPSTRTVTLTINTSDRDWKKGIWYTLSVSSSIQNINEQRQSQSVKTNFRTAS